MRMSRIVALAATSALALAACAPVDSASTSPGASSTSSTAGYVTPGKFTVATSSPAYAPWVIDDDPSNGKGFESTVAYEVADALGFARTDVVWVRDSFDQIIAPGVKNFDVAINQVSISDERSKSLDFSSSYYDTAQAVVTLTGRSVVGATTIAQLKGAKLGAMVGTTSLQVATDVIAPTTAIAVFNDNDQAKQALTAGLVDAIVVDLPTALYITAAELDGGVLVGQLPAGTNPDTFGLVLDKGSPLTARVTTAVDKLRADGALTKLETTWLTDTAGAPVLK